ncbi:hypothetical protein BVY00_00455 [bacterium G20]|nr:hypothetical protein BVY00_00455 [bacterium G20]
MSPNQKQAPSRGQIPIVVLTGGGSGGHITPLLSLAHALKAKDPKCRIIYIGLKGDKIETTGGRYEVFDSICYISSGKFRRYHDESLASHLKDPKTLALNFVDVFKVVLGTFSAWRLLKKHRPSVIFSKGGYVVVPAGVAAHILGVPIVTHDSDAAAGLANRIIGRWAQVHATGMPAHYYSYPKDTIRYTGIPIDERVKPVNEDLQRLLRRLVDLPADSLVLVVAGGGLGSQRLNELMIKISPSLFEKYPKLRIVHFSGSGHQDSVAEHYRRELGADMPERVKVIGFSSDFYAYTGAADVVLARAGATTLAELAVQQKAAIIIPSPFLTGGHQLRNAEELTTQGAAKVLPNDVSPQKLLKILDELLQNKQMRAELEQKISALARPDAAAKIAEILLQISTHHVWT